MERLQKIISAAGVASRRKAEELITSGLVQVNGQTVTELGTKADAGKDHIRVNGKLIKFTGHHVYILLNKPKGYVTTLSDPEGRPTIVDLLRGVKERVYPVGRLDYASEGLLLLTNDGAMANSLTKAASHVPKTYLVKISGQPSDAAIEQLRAGIELPDRKGIHSRTAPAGIQLVHKAENPWYEVTLIEGRNRQVRAMFEQTGHHVEKLKRVRYGPFTLDVHPGKFRNLLPEEVEQLRSAIQRGSRASAEASVRPADGAESHIETALREEARSGVKFQAESAVQDKPKRAPKQLGRGASGRGTDSSRPGKTRPGELGGSDFRKKSPAPGRFRRDGAPFQKRAGAAGPRPVRPRSTGERPVWSKPGSSGSSARGAGQKWESRGSSAAGRPPVRDQQRPAQFRPSAAGVREDAASNARGDNRERRPGAPSPNIRPRTYDQNASTAGRPARSSARPEGKNPSSFRSKAPTSFGPRKWTNNAPSPKARVAGLNRAKPGGFERDTARPRSEGSAADRPRTERPRADRPRADRARADRPRADRPRTDGRSKPRFKEERGGAGRAARPGAPAVGSSSSAQQPFWKGADKRRPGKKAVEGDFETGAVERAPNSASFKPGRPKFKPSRPKKNDR
jgi:23S rRNA pseudouridine2605 synthase